jgi:anti-sigma factor RsiW
MGNHLTAAMLNALVDGELTGQEFERANRHLSSCSACTGNALDLSLLKSATAKAGRRYAPPAHLPERLMRLAERRRWGRRTPATLRRAGLLLDGLKFWDGPLPLCLF